VTSWGQISKRWTCFAHQAIQPPLFYHSSLLSVGIVTPSYNGEAEITREYYTVEAAPHIVVFYRMEAYNSLIPVLSGA
jgi:hypothetical protein